MKPEDEKLFKKMADGDLLGLTMFLEARGEPVEGKIAVGCVVRNRTIKWKKSYFEIISSPNQFSCFNSNDPNYFLGVSMVTDIFKGIMPEDLTGKFQECRWLAMGIVNQSILDNTKGALYYHNPKVCNPSWVKEMTTMKIIGNHNFLKEMVK